MYNNFKDFRKFAISNGVSSLRQDRFFNGVVNPYIVEERTGNPLQIDVFSKLFTDRILVLGAEINEETANIINCQLLYLQADSSTDPITMYINSPGGSVYAGLSIYDTMQTITPPVHTICMGLAASMASVLLCCGENGNRKALEHSRILIHQPMGGVPSGTQASDIEIANKEIQTLKSELYEIMAAHTGMALSEIISACDRDSWLRSFEAKEFGLIDEIVLGKQK